MFEHKGQRPIPAKKFYLRLLKSFSHVVMIIGISLCIGVFGYHFLEQLNWIDALLNASMILGGMGPVDVLKTDAGKIFASVYALYSGLLLIGLAAWLLAPIFHRMLHLFHHQRT